MVDTSGYHFADSRQQVRGFATGHADVHMPSQRRLDIGSEIEFVSGRVYQYFDVPQAHFDGLLNAAHPN